MARMRRKVNMSEIKDPRGITLTKSPANQTGFKVIRSESGAEESPLRAIAMAEGSTGAMADALKDAYKLKDYEVEESDGKILVKQSSYTTDEETTSVSIGNGNVAMIALSVFDNVKTHAPVARTEKKPTPKHPALVSLSFANDKFPDAKSVNDWLESHKVSYPEGAVERSDALHHVVRLPNVSSDGLTVNLGEGVEGCVVRADAADVPQPVYRMVAEQVYGYYSDWELLDFAMAMANPDYTSDSWDAIYVLKDVLENIVLYSSLTIDERKTLIGRATSSYAEYMISLLDSLPEPVMLQERSDKSSTPEIPKMTDTKAETKKVDDKIIARSDETKTDETSTEEGFVTRTEIEEIVTKAFESYEAKRSDQASKEAEVESTEVARTDETPTVDPLVAIAEAITVMATRMDSVESTVKDAAKVAAEQEDSVTVTRSEEETEAVQRKDNVSPFVGMFGSKLQA